MMVEHVISPAQHLLSEMYMKGSCVDLASALSRTTGYPMRILDAADYGCIAHAFLVINQSGRREEWMAADAKGVRSVATILEEFEESHGRLRWRKNSSPPEYDPRFTPPDEVFLAIAARVSHLAPLVGAAAPGPSADEDLGRILHTILRCKHTSTEGKWQPVLDLLETLDDAPALAPTPGM